jgi:hypothetical protein
MQNTSTPTRSEEAGGCATLSAEVDLATSCVQGVKYKKVCIYRAGIALAFPGPGVRWRGVGGIRGCMGTARPNVDDTFLYRPSAPTSAACRVACAGDCADKHGICDPTRDATPVVGTACWHPGAVYSRNRGISWVWSDCQSERLSRPPRRRLPSESGWEPVSTVG